MKLILAIVLSTLLLPVTEAGASSLSTPISPGASEHASSTSSSCPTFSWALREAAEALELVVFEVSDLGRLATQQEPVIETILSGHATSWTPPSSLCLTRGRSYGWAVRAVGGDRVDWSDVFLFRIDDRPDLETVERALAVLRDYKEYLASEGRLAMQPSFRSGRGAPARGAGSAFRSSSAPQSTFVGGTAALRGENVQASGVNHGIVGIANSASGAGVVAANANGPSLVTEGGPAAIGLDDPSSETSLHVRTPPADHFGVLVDAAGVPGSEVGLHVGPARYASIAKNAYFDAGWQRFETSVGAFLQEIEPDGQVSFKVAEAGTNPIFWQEALRIEAGGHIRFTSSLQLPAGVLAPDPVDCSATDVGRTYYDSADDLLYICNGSQWKRH